MTEFLRDILLVTIPASLVLIATLGARFLEHWLQEKREARRQGMERERETRDVRRKYRENVVTPVKEALTRLQSGLETKSLVDDMSRAKDKGFSFPPETTKAIELLREQLQRDEVKSQWKVATELVPLAAAINNRDTRKHTEKAFFILGWAKR